MSRRDLNQAKAVLEAWAYWMATNNGFPEASPITKLSQIGGTAYGSRLPDGIDGGFLVNDALLIFLLMSKDPNNRKSLKHVDILKQYYLGRRKGETIRGFCKRIQQFNHNDYVAAINEFAHKLDMYYLLQDLERSEQEIRYG